MYCFSQASRLYSITLCTLSETDHELVLVLNLLCGSHNFLYRESWLKVLHYFPLSLFLVKMIYYCEVYVILQNIQYRIQRNILYHYLYCSFFMKSLLN